MKSLMRTIGDAWGGPAQARAERDRALAERDKARVAEEAMRVERDLAREERDKARVAEEAMRVEGDLACEERDKARVAEEAMRVERDLACEERDKALAERDGARRRFDAAIVPAEDEAAAPRLRARICQDGKNKAKRALVVPLCGTIADREIAVTQPFFETYCRRAGIDLLIVEVPPTTPKVWVKASLHSVVDGYERFAIVEPHMIIRQDCPDLFTLVPEHKVGAVVEGRWTDRRAQCTELGGLCGFSTPFPAERYLNTDLLVMSHAHLLVLQASAKDAISDYRLSAQDALNALFYLYDVQICSLSRDFNWIPYSHQEFDWRWAWIFNMANCWRSPPTQEHAWTSRGVYAGGRYSRTKLAPEHCRLPSLIEIAEQLRGNIVRSVNPAEMSYRGLSARVHLTEDEAAVMWCGTTSPDKAPPIYGPYLDLPAGRWSVSLLAPDGVTPADPEIVVDVVHDVGRNMIRPAGPIGAQATFEITLDRDVSQIEVRIYAGNRDYTVGCIAFKSLPDRLAGESNWVSDLGRSSNLSMKQLSAEF